MGMRTIQSVLDEFDRLKPNAYTTQEKFEWLNELDFKIDREIHSAYEGYSKFNGHNNVETQFLHQLMLVEEPYDTMYLYWLESKVDYYNRDFAAYNNSASQFSAAYSEYWRYYNRTHKAIQTPMQYLS